MFPATVGRPLSFEEGLVVTSNVYGYILVVAVLSPHRLMC